MMDFKTPAPDRYRHHGPQDRPLATVPPPASHQPAVKESKGGLNARRLAVAVLGLIAWLTYGYITTKNQVQ